MQSKNFECLNKETEEDIRRRVNESEGLTYIKRPSYQKQSIDLGQSPLTSQTIFIDLNKKFLASYVKTKILGQLK